MTRASRTPSFIACGTASKLNADLNKLADDYHDYFDKIGDKLAAHRQGLPIDQAWDVWNQIDAATVGILTDDRIHQRKARLCCAPPGATPAHSPSDFRFGSTESRREEASRTLSMRSGRG